MLLTYLVLAISVSIDSLGIGITYGLRNTKITRFAKIILFIISVLITAFSVCIGNTISNIFPKIVTTFIGSIFLAFMGLFVIYQSLKNKDEIKKDSKLKNEQKVYKFFIDFLGITIQIIRNPISSDLDGSKNIDWKEALYLGIALSIDSVCIGICSSVIGYGSLLFPILVALFQLSFLSVGRFLGEKISSVSSIPENIWNVLSGVLLICIGISRFFV